jgi:hypothetical protein
MRTQLRAALFGLPSNGLAFSMLAVIGAIIATPLVVCRYLPLVDLPLHQLELAIAHGRSVDGTPFDSHYELASRWLPYWSSVWLAQAFIPLTGLSIASRLPVALYAGGLPLLIGLLCVVTRRSPWFALLIVPFIYEHNLSHGFIAYCLGVALFVACLAWTLHIEAQPRIGELLALTVLSIALGFTHPQMIPPMVAAVVGIVILGRGSRRIWVALAASTAAIPLGVWGLQPSAARYTKGEGISFLSPFDTTRGLAHMLDVYPDATEVLFFASFIGVLALCWVANEDRSHWRDHRLLVVTVGALVSAYVLPLAWNGQMVSLRMLLPALVLMPALTPPDLHPTRLLRVGLMGIALLGAAQLVFTVYGFDRDTARSLDPLIDASISAPRVAQIVYDPNTPWVNPPALTHAGAWLVFERGGVYAYSFDTLTTHHTARVPQAQRMTGSVSAPASALKTGKLYIAREADFSFWDTWLIRWTAGGAAPLPVFTDASRWHTVRSHEYTLHQRVAR